MRPTSIALLLFASFASPAATAEDFPSCADGVAHALPAGSSRHSVKLSWDASVPANAKPGSKVAGYNIYRSESGPCARPDNKCLPINHVLIKTTNCIDYEVRSGHTYTYRAQGISVNAVPSTFSNEAKARVP